MRFTKGASRTQFMRRARSKKMQTEAAQSRSQVIILVRGGPRWLSWYWPQSATAQYGSREFDTMKLARFRKGREPLQEMEAEDQNEHMEAMSHNGGGHVRKTGVGHSGQSRPMPTPLPPITLLSLIANGVDRPHISASIRPGLPRLPFGPNILLRMRHKASECGCRRRDVKK